MVEMINDAALNAYVFYVFTIIFLIGNMVFIRYLQLGRKVNKDFIGCLVFALSISLIFILIPIGLIR